MDLKAFPNSQKSQYNKLVTHIVQSWEWGEFRQKLGSPILRFGLFEGEKAKAAFSLTLHQIPLLNNKYVGYLPKGPLPDRNLAQALLKIGQENYCVAIKVEPDFLVSQVAQEQIDPKFIPSKKDVFAKYNYLIDLTQSETQLLQNMHPKARYNIRVAKKHQVWVEERTDEQAFQIYLKLYFETVNRQKYHGHSKLYHSLLWQSLSQNKMARILIAFYKPPDETEVLPLTAWMILNFKDTLYYPYGGSSLLHRNVMATNLVAWEAIQLGKRLKLKTFDLWGALAPDASPNHPWQGFHGFKAKLGGDLVSYLGAYDLVFDPLTYTLFSQVDRFTTLKVLLLKALKK